LAGIAGRPGRFSYVHAAAADQPLLWVADIVVSAVAGAVAYGDKGFAAALEPILATVECEP
jgi:hypothetical protein